MRLLLAASLAFGWCGCAKRDASPADDKAPHAAPPAPAMPTEALAMPTAAPAMPTAASAMPTAAPTRPCVVPSSPAPQAPSDKRRFRHDEFLIDVALPVGWEGTGGPGYVRFARDATPAHGRSVVSVGLAKQPTGTTWTNRTKIGDREARWATSGDTVAYVVENPRGETLVFEFQTKEATQSEIDALLRAVRFLPSPDVPAGATFELYGVVTRAEGNCMPPGGCAKPKVAREIVVKKRGGGVVARTSSGPDGIYCVLLSPGTYSVMAVEEGKEECAGSGPNGPCGTRIIDRAVKFDIRIDRAVW